MLDSIYHMTLKLLKNENVKISPSFTQHYNGRPYVSRTGICKPLVAYRFYFMALYHSQMRRHLIKIKEIRVKLRFFHYLTLYLLASSADMFCKHFNPDQARQNVGPN